MSNETSAIMHHLTLGVAAVEKCEGREQTPTESLTNRQTQHCNARLPDRTNFTIEQMKPHFLQSVPCLDKQTFALDGK